MNYFPFVLALLFASACTPIAPQPRLTPEETEYKMIKLQENFPEYDRNGDDLLSHTELKNAMIRGKGKNVTDTKVRKVIEFYDFNKDGKISLREAQSGAVSGPEELLKKLS